MSEHTHPRGRVALSQLCLGSLLFGIMITSLLPMLLNVGKFERDVGVLLMPGGALASIISPGEIIPHPVVLLAGNAIFYALCCFGICLIVKRRLTSSVVRVGTFVFGLGAVTLLILTCVPSYNPLWPRGIAQLRTRELKLSNLINSDMTIDQVRALLMQESLPVREETENSRHEIVQNRDTKIVASAGDRLIFSRVRTNAIQYPCGYDLQVVVLFSPDGKLKNHYVATLPVCP